MFVPRKLFPLVLSIFLMPCEASSSPQDDVAKVIETLGRMEDALKARDRSLFESLWYPAGYGRNIVGGSGMAGKHFFLEASLKGWFLRPELIPKRRYKRLKRRRPSEIVRIGDYIYRVIRTQNTLIMSCLIWSWRENRAVDDLYVALVRHEREWLFLGIGEGKTEVKALVQRYVNGDPL